MLTRVIGHDKLAMRANRAPGRALTKKILSLELDTIYLAIPLDFGYRWVSSGWDWPPAENGGLQPKCVLFLSAHQKRAHRKSPFCPRGGSALHRCPSWRRSVVEGVEMGRPEKCASLWSRSFSFFLTLFLRTPISLWVWTTKLRFRAVPKKGIEKARLQKSARHRRRLRERTFEVGPFQLPFWETPKSQSGPSRRCVVWESAKIV